MPARSLLFQASCPVATLCKGDTCHPTTMPYIITVLFTPPLLPIALHMAFSMVRDTVTCSHRLITAWLSASTAYECKTRNGKKHSLVKWEKDKNIWEILFPFTNPITSRVFLQVEIRYMFYVKLLLSWSLMEVKKQDYVFWLGLGVGVVAP